MECSAQEFDWVLNRGAPENQAFAAGFTGAAKHVL